MEFIGAIIEVIKCFVGPICSYIDHHRKLEENIHDLRRKVGHLNIKKQDVELRKEAEIRGGKVIKREVEKWLEDVERMKTNLQIIEDKFLVASYFTRGHLGKLVSKKIEEVERIYQQGNFPEGVALEGALTIGLTLPTTKLEGEIDVKEQIWKYLMGDEVGMVGVCGMGGIGKTTVMKHINNQLVVGDRFDQVIWVTVSKELNTNRVQQDIARALKIEHSFPTNELERAAVLKANLEQKKYVLILDDVWERFALLDVGIIEATLGKERKVVLTSRSIEVCKSMGCKVVKVKSLSKEESMNLFIYHVGDHVRQNQDLHDIVEKVVDQCSGLPLAIATIGGTMKGEDDICEWRNALKELEERVKSVKGSNIEIYEQLKFSYDRLKNYLNIKDCFLYCALYPEDYNMQKVNLIENWIDEGLLDDLETRQATHDRGHSILNKLVNNCLLEIVDEEKVKMHDVLRDMALNIKSSDHFMVKAGVQLKEIPGEDIWKTCLEKVSLMKNKEMTIPPHLSPKCPHLTTLLLQRCHGIKCFSESFFMHLQTLKVLDLSYSGITHLPNSISFLKNLNALILAGCRHLRSLPSLAEVKALSKLDLFHCNIEEVPQGIEMLEKLTYLSLCSKYLNELPVGIISSRISHLQCLITMDMHLRGGEVGQLGKLEILVCSFYRMQEFEKYVTMRRGEFPTNFYITVGPILDSKCLIEEMFSFKKRERQIVFRGCGMGNIDNMIVVNGLHTVYINRCDDLKYCPSKLRGVKHYEISSCKGIECMVDLSSSSSSSSSSSYNALQGIEVLCLSDLRNLREIVRVKPPTITITCTITINVFSSLTELLLSRCPMMETLFPVALLHGLQNLEKMEIYSCDEMEKIFQDEGATRTLILPKLKSFKLYDLPKLKHICGVGIMIPTDHLQNLIIHNCRKLKRIPLCLPLSENGQPYPPPSLEVIHVWSKGWWELVELDESSSSSIKDVLSPFVTYGGY